MGTLRSIDPIGGIWAGHDPSQREPDVLCEEQGLPLWTTTTKKNCGSTPTSHVTYPGKKHKPDLPCKNPDPRLWKTTKKKNCDCTVSVPCGIPQGWGDRFAPNEEAAMEFERVYGSPGDPQNARPEPRVSGGGPQSDTDVDIDLETTPDADLDIAAAIAQTDTPAVTPPSDIPDEVMETVRAALAETQEDTSVTASLALLSATDHDMGFEDMVSVSSEHFPASPLPPPAEDTVDVAALAAEAAEATLELPEDTSFTGSDAAPLPVDITASETLDFDLGPLEPGKAAQGTPGATFASVGAGGGGASGFAVAGAGTSAEASGESGDGGADAESSDAVDASTTPGGGLDTTLIVRRSLITTTEATPPPPDAPPQVGPILVTEVVPGPSFEEVATVATAASTDPTRDSTVLPVVPSRALPRVLSVIFTLIFAPIAWYLFVEASTRLWRGAAGASTPPPADFLALGELFGGLIAVVIVAILAAQSSLGLIVTGAITLALGLPFIITPEWTWGILDRYLAPLWESSDATAGLFVRFSFSGFTGLLVIAGFVMVAVGWVIAAVRRTGRREEMLRLVVASTNPTGLKARWARKATDRANSIR